VSVEYRIVARDAAQNTASTGWYGVPTENAASVIVSPSADMPPASVLAENDQVKAYRIVSVPYVLTEKRPSQHVPASLGNHMNNGVNYYFWRMQREINGAREDYESFKDQGIIQPGAGFFLIVRESGKRLRVNNTISSVMPVQDLTTTGLSLGTGWNIVGTPLPQDLNFSDFSFVGGTYQDRAYYTGTGPVSGWEKSGTSVDVFRPWEGIAVRVNGPSSLRYRVPVSGSAQPNGFLSTIPIRASVVMGEGSANWYIPVDAVRPDNGRRCLGNGFGMAANAKNGYDTYDSYQPPFVADRNVAVSFDGEDGALMQDVRAISQEGGLWLMKVRTGDEGAKVRLTFGAGTVLPDPTHQVFLIDVDQQMAFDLQKRSVIDINSGTGLRQFRIVAGTKAFVRANNGGVDLYPKSMVLSPNYPNPFNPETIIRYTVPDVSARSQVNLSVFNLLGQQVATLVNAEQSTGYYEVMFDGRSYGSGVYFYRITVQSGGNMWSDIKKMVLVK
jgi:hypothetical protein